MNTKSQLAQAIDSVSARSHKRTFKATIGGVGVDLVCPRLSLRNQAEFERLVRRTDEKRSIFTLSGLRSSAQMHLARCSSDVIDEFRSMKVPEKFSSEDDAKLWTAQFQAKLVTRFQPYAEQLFQSFTKDLMLAAVGMALRQEYGDTEAGTEGAAAYDYSDAKLALLFEREDTGELLDQMFLFTIGIVDVPEEGGKEKIAESLADLAEKVAGGVENPPTTPGSSGG